MKIKFSLLLILYSSICNILKAQDSALIVFKNKMIFLPNFQSECRSILNDSLHIECLFGIGKEKYFYIKQNIQDSLVIEAGQLNLYSIADNFYLLREGVWTIESEAKKILFSNSGKKGIIEEMEVDMSPENYEGFDKRKNRPIRRASKKNY